ncbi:MAG: TetR/AcrR family transcriptional regulator [Bacteroidota bacterium]
MKKISKQEWLEESLNVLASDGHQGLKIDRMCKRLSVTKGSFYHHFSSLERYKKQVLQFVLSQHLPHRDLKALPESQLRVEQALRGWAQQEQAARDILHQLDESRIGLLKQQYVEEGLVPRVAQDIAQMAYAGFLGIQQLRGLLPEAELESMWYMLNRMLKTEVERRKS